VLGVALALHLYRSNRVELLAEAAAELLNTPVGRPFEADCIVVQGRGMAVWLALQLARRHGVFTAGGFLYPRNFVERLFGLALGEGIGAGYARQALPWAVWRALDQHLARPELAPLAHYLAGDVGGRRRFQLARRIADVFDQYATYRPDWVRAWERGDDGLAIEHGEAWQPLLWRALAASLGSTHAAALERELLKRLSSSEAIEGLPPRVVVFGIASLPPLYVRVLAALARRVETHWFLPAPCAGYFADMVAEEIDRGGGHPLLASLGRLGAELQVVLAGELEAMAVAEDEPRGELFVAPSDGSELARLQHDVLRNAPRVAAGARDGSIAIHSCHGPMRQVEVLHDQLLDILGKGEVRPHEVVVMMPDVEAYAPLIEAVFAREPGDARHIPFHIADRGARRDGPVVDAFLRILALVGGRAPASEVLDLLALPAVQRRFAIAPEELGTVRRWVIESGVRWGIDAAHRAEHGQPAEAEGTWRFGLARLLLGTALPSRGRELFAGALGYDEIEGNEGELLGKLASFCEVLFGAMRQLGRTRRLEAWAEPIGAVLDLLVVQDATTAWEHRLVRRAWAAACEGAAQSGFDEAVGIDVVRAIFADALEESEPARGFLAGGVTFCAMVPMRNIPFRVVCLLGMSDGAFPRLRRPADFDLMQKHGARRPGDRSRRDDDRYLFLEALLAARDRVLLFYDGQSARDGAKLPPSVVVAELAEVASVTAVEHPLQPFSPRYFDGARPELFSYASEARNAAEALVSGSREPAAPLFVEALPPVEVASLSLAELVRFVTAPVRYLLNHRLGVDLHERELAVHDREPVELGPLERYAIGERLLNLRLGDVSGESEPLLRAEGMLPLGTPGTLEHEEAVSAVEAIAARILALREGGRRPSRAVSLTLPSGVILHGDVGDRWARGQLMHQYARVSGKHLIELWVRHLALSVEESFLVGRAGARAGSAPLSYRLRPVSDAAARLDDLVACYRRGLEVPLVLFPRAGLEYAKRIARGEGKDKAFAGARRIFQDEELVRDAHVLRVFGDAGVIDLPAFAEVSLRVMGPLVAHLEELP
jgi:exodeoxyribonuclease V gamma subunit